MGHHHRSICIRKYDTTFTLLTKWSQSNSINGVTYRYVTVKKDKYYGNFYSIHKFVPIAIYFSYINHLNFILLSNKWNYILYTFYYICIFLTKKKERTCWVPCLRQKPVLFIITVLINWYKLRMVFSIQFHKQLQYITLYKWGGKL